MSLRIPHWATDTLLMSRHENAVDAVAEVGRQLTDTEETFV